MRGYAGMRKAIRSILPSKELLALADDGILISYRQIESHLLGGMSSSAYFADIDVGIFAHTRT